MNWYGEIAGNLFWAASAMNDVEAVGHYDEADTRLARKRSYHAFNLASIVNGICARLDSKRSRRGLQRSLVIAGDKRGRLRIEQKCEPRNARRHFLEHFHPFAHHRRFEVVNPVMFPPGWARLAMKPAPIGSET